MENLKLKALISLISSYASQLATTAANLATKVIIARLIVPEDLGQYALALFILLGGDVLIDLGISQHLIREKHRPYGNVLLLRLLLSSILFISLIAISPLLKFWGASFPALVRLMAIVLVIKAVSGVPNVFLDRELLIHKSLIPQLARLITMGAASILLAYFGYGVWALAWGTVISELAFAVLMWTVSISKMPLDFTWNHTRTLIRDSKYLFLIAIMGFALQQGDIAILGALVDEKQIGYFAMALSIIVLVSKVVETAIYRVIYPMFCEFKDNMQSLGYAYRQATLAITVAEAPIYFYLLFNAPGVTSLLLGDKWLPAAFLIQIMSISGIINPYSTFGYEVLRAMKKDKILTFTMIASAIILMVSGYILTARYGAAGMAAAHYIMIGSLPTIITVYKIVKPDFIILTRQMAIVYATSFAVMFAASFFLPLPPKQKSLAVGLLIPFCWYIYYRIFGRAMGKETIGILKASRTTMAELET